jgi:hypothetical protein
LRAAAQAGADYSLLLADSLEFNAHLVHNLATWPLVRQRMIGLACLMDSGQGEVARIPASRALTLDTRGGLDFQALLLSRGTVRFLLEHWMEGSPRLDHKLGTLAARWDWPVFCHCPSLVKPATRVPSETGYVRALNFKRHWRASEQQLSPRLVVVPATEETGNAF